jgi:beta-lactam-binding protein with PASTA domain
MLLADAQLRLFDRNCALGNVTRVKSRTVRKGRVISQTPAAGRILVQDAPIRLLVSRGK